MEQALKVGKDYFGEDAIVWTTKLDSRGIPYKTERFRIGYPAGPYEIANDRRYCELHEGVLKRFKGIGGSWGECVDSLSGSTPRETPEVPPANHPKLAPEVRAAYEAKLKAEADKAAAEAQAKAEAEAEAKAKAEAEEAAKRKPVKSAQPKNKRKAA
jgi:hypothetical protein